jgi:hypothetical protein
MRLKRKSTRLKDRSVRSDATTEDENSSTYQESNDSSSRTSSDNDNDGDGTGGGITSPAAQGGGHERHLSPFMADQFTHCTQDEDHGVPTSPRISVSEADALVGSSSSSCPHTWPIYISHLRHSQSATYPVGLRVG